MSLAYIRIRDVLAGSTARVSLNLLQHHVQGNTIATQKNYLDKHLKFKI